MSALIDLDAPAAWADLEQSVAKILSECGMSVRTGVSLDLARGTSDVDVLAQDDSTNPQSTMIVECKHWRRKVSKHVVHAFRTIVSDAGANTGLIVSLRGFQEGALEAAAHTNVLLLSWESFQELFLMRWFERYMVPTLLAEVDALIEYTEPINTRIFDKADRLRPELQTRFTVLREKHWRLAFSLSAWAYPWAHGNAKPVPPQLPFGDGGESDSALPTDVANQPALRPFMTSLIQHFRRATAEFDEVFGERA